MHGAGRCPEPAGHLKHRAGLGPFIQLFIEVKQQKSSPGWMCPRARLGIPASSRDRCSLQGARGPLGAVAAPGPAPRWISPRLAAQQRCWAGAVPGLCSTPLSQAAPARSAGKDPCQRADAKTNRNVTALSCKQSSGCRPNLALPTQKTALSIQTEVLPQPD